MIKGAKYDNNSIVNKIENNVMDCLYAILGYLILGFDTGIKIM